MKKKYSKDELKRLEEFNRARERYIESGYKETYLKISIVKANVFSVIVLVLAWFVFGYGYFAYNKIENLYILENAFEFLIFGVLILLFIILHELVHGFVWSLFTENGFKDIAFGVISYLTPYCTVKVPLEKKAYIMGGMAPLFVVGILPAIIGILISSPIITIIGIFMIAGAAGDILIVYNILKYKTKSREIFLYDLPTEAGCLVFEK